MTLTDREIDVLRLAAEGLTRKEIAYRLGISFDTTKTHLWKAKNKARRPDPDRGVPPPRLAPHPGFD